MLINRLLSAETAESESEFVGAIKSFFHDLFYGGSDMQYENFSFGNSVFTYRMIIIAIFLGLIIASAVMIYKRKVLGRFIRALSEKKAFSPSEAKSLSELKLEKNRMILHSLKRGTLKRMVPSFERDEHSRLMRELMREKGENKEASPTEKKKDVKAEEKKKKKPIISDYIPHPDKDRYYLPEDEKKRMAMVSLFDEKGSGTIGLILTIIGCVICGAVLFWAVPWLLSLLDSAL